ncbi:hypothetical protein [Buchnera aphidicola]|uniref:hypothetical protein n=1 Tax=Buchnera aphidicola TaxID=9 RepID=UPI00205C9575|nr:hypothetical protein [Buchnera aphidicola]UPT14375.1 hypothetical protein HWH54_00085 [Buchnera aphidicola (Aphis gossypii)]
MINLIKDTIDKINLKELSAKIIDLLQEKICAAYKAIKNEIINLFDGTTFKKIFDAGYKFIMGSSMDESTKQVNDKIDSLIEYVKKLRKTIESSKTFIHALIERIREQGRLRVINKLNHNPKHPEYESSFPDLDVEIPKEENFKIQYPNDLDEDFNIIVQQRSLKVNQSFKDKMNRSIEKAHYNYFDKDKHPWTVFKEPPSYPQSNNTVSYYKDMYKDLEVPKELHEYFMIDFDSAVFLIDGHLISSSTKEEMIKSFKKLITNDIEQKFISQYANPTLLKPSYLKLIAENPALNGSHIVRANNFYEITHLEDGTIRIVATNLSDFYSVNANDVTEHHSFGVKTTVIFSYSDAPIIKHSYFVN